MKRRWSDVFLEKPESNHVRSLFARIVGGKVKRRNNATLIIRPADAQDFAINRHRRNFIRAVHNAMEAGADIINISFSRTASRDATDTIAKILPELTSIFDGEWVSSFAQPAYSCRTVGSVMSFFRTRVPTCSLRHSWIQRKACQLFC